MIDVALERAENYIFDIIRLSLLRYNTAVGVYLKERKIEKVFGLTNQKLIDKAMRQLRKNFRNAGYSWTNKQGDTILAWEDLKKINYWDNEEILYL